MLPEGKGRTTVDLEDTSDAPLHKMMVSLTTTSTSRSSPCTSLRPINGRIVLHGTDATGSACRSHSALPELSPPLLRHGLLARCSAIAHLGLSGRIRG